ncbi:MAG TPA: hypothetical protein VFJ02_09410, partial [Vicinamibacterales bacterium]|nr:hypothetical protein [Vicinamibacterales bacterium]
QSGAAIAAKNGGVIWTTKEANCRWAESPDGQSQAYAAPRAEQSVYRGRTGVNHARQPRRG